MSSKSFNAIDVYWRTAPTKLKDFVKHQIRNNGYRDNGALRAHIWECLKIEVSLDCCQALISHYTVK